jgi:hypothetical protein
LLVHLFFWLLKFILNFDLLFRRLALLKSSSVLLFLASPGVESHTVPLGKLLMISVETTAPVLALALTHANA